MTTTTAPTTDERAAARLAELRAAIPDDEKLPAATTRAELAAVQQQRATLDAQIAALRDATAALASLGNAEDDERWLAFLTTARQTLVDARMQIKSPIRNAHTLGVARNLEMSIRCIDFGPQRAFKDSGWELENSRLGALMVEAGYAIVGADPARNFGGQLPWHGTLPEVEKRIADLAQRRADAQAALDEALLGDDERAKRDAENAQLRDAFNAMNVKIAPDGRGLVAYDADGDPIDVSKLTAIQRRALDRMNELFVRR